MAATRISGIVFGVFLSLLLCVVVFPKSATHEAVDNMWHAMTDLSALHALAWTGGRHEGPPGALPSSSSRRSLACAPPASQPSVCLYVRMG